MPAFATDDASQELAAGDSVQTQTITNEEMASQLSDESTSEDTTSDNAGVSGSTNQTQQATGGNNESSAPAIPVQDEKATISLDLPDQVVLVEKESGNKYDLQDATIDVAANAEYQFTLEVGDGLVLDTVKTVSANGSETELTYDENKACYSVAADAVVDGLTIKAEVTQAPAADGDGNEAADPDNGGTEGTTDNNGSETDNGTVEGNIDDDAFDVDGALTPSAVANSLPLMTMAVDARAAGSNSWYSNRKSIKVFWDEINYWEGSLTIGKHYYEGESDSLNTTEVTLDTAKLIGNDQSVDVEDLALSGYTLVGAYYGNIEVASFQINNSGKLQYKADSGRDRDWHNVNDVSQIVFYYEKAEEPDPDPSEPTDRGPIIFEYAGGSNQNTSASSVNHVKFMIEFVDENGNSVDWPDGFDASDIPDEITYGSTVTLNANTFGEISVPGYSFDNAYFYWSGDYRGEKKAVDSFHNFGGISDNYSYYNSYIGFTSSEQGIGKDYTQSWPEDEAAGYFAYNPTGTLHVVFKAISKANPPDTFYFSMGDQIGSFEDDAEQDGKDWKYYPIDKRAEYTADYMQQNHMPESEEGGTWTFEGWSTKQLADGSGNGDPNSMVSDGFFTTDVNSDTRLYAVWSYEAPVEKKGTVSYNLTMDGAQWVEDPGYTVNEKGFYEVPTKYAQGDPFNVTTAVPKCDGYEFLGWFDKDRTGTEGGQPAAIRTADESLTFIYKDTDAYTLDALWASIKVEGENTTYDGKSHGLTTDEVEFNGGSLGQKYIQQIEDGNLVKFSETKNYRYSTDGGETWTEWTTTSPEFINAGTYLVQVKQDIKVGNATKTISGEGTVVINKVNVTITADNKSKAYGEDNPELTYTTEGLVNNETLAGIGINPVLSTTADKYSVADEYPITFNQGLPNTTTNYNITYNDGELTVTQNATAIVLQANNASRDYNGTALTEPDFTIASGTLADGDYIDDVVMTEDSTITNAGSVDNKIESFKVYNKDGVDVTSSYSNITKQAGTLTVNKAELIVYTQSASKTYDGTPLTAGSAVLDGLQGDDVNKVTVTATGSQTAVGQSTNWYSINWNGALADNYNITEHLGQLVVNPAPADPGDNPGGGGDGGTTPTPGDGTNPGGGATADDGTATETIDDAATPLAASAETIGDDGVPMSDGTHPDCWVHWLMIIGCIITVIYFGGVGIRRRNFTNQLNSFEDDVLGNNDKNNA